jgi:delta-aminolevulinic acid dehydratase/porphobilinogen synthase
MSAPEATPVLDLAQRPRRNRRTQALRAAVRETSLSAQHLVLPLFVQEGTDRKDPIGAMPGCYRLSIDHIVAISKGFLSSGFFCTIIYFNSAFHCLEARAIFFFYF